MTPLRTIFRHIETRPVDTAWRAGTIPSKMRPGDCFRQATEFVLAKIGIVSNMEWVEGLVTAGFPIEHAWVETRGVIFDGVAQQFYDKDSYYAVLKAKPMRRYTPDQVKSFVISQRHGGPWEVPDKDHIYAQLEYSHGKEVADSWLARQRAKGID